MTIKAPLAGQVISHSRYLQPVADAVNRLEENINVGDGPAGEGEETAPAIQTAIFVTEKTDTLECVLWETGEALEIAKPPTLRGNIGTRINSDGDTEEIYPGYHPAFPLMVAQVAYTGVTGIEWADLNWEARRWTIEID